MKKDNLAEKIDNFLERGVENIYPSLSFLKSKLEKEEKLTFYLGIDPTGPDLHIGHAIVLRKMKELQDLGHHIIILIGDFTGMIGDPTDKSATRVPLTRAQVLHNAKNYQVQAGKIIDFSGDNPAEIKYNSEWLDKMSFREVIDLTSHFTVQRLLERDMFDKRLKEGKPIHLHEFLYPVMQAYDCVVMDVDGEMGGNDQMFNMLAGRTLLKTMQGKEKIVIVMKLLTDPTGKKMGKSEGNMITLSDSAQDMFGKIMSWPDGLIIRGLELITDLSMEEIKKREKAMENEKVNPRDIKIELAGRVVEFYYDVAEAKKVQENFSKMFKTKEVPENIQDFEIKEKIKNILDILVDSQLVKSKTEARRLIDGGGIKVDGEVVEDYDLEISKKTEGVLIQKGKRFFIRVI